MPEYGVEMRNADNVLSIGGQRTFARLVSSHDVAGDETVSISVPAFDDQRGTIVFYPKATKIDGNNNVIGYASTQAETSTLHLSMHQLPTLDWDNTTKILSVTPATFLGPVRPDFLVNFFHYR